MSASAAALSFPFAAFFPLRVAYHVVQTFAAQGRQGPRAGGPGVSRCGEAAMPMLGHYVALDRKNFLGITTDEGVYELYDGTETLYLGSSGDDPYGLRGRLEAHLNGDLEPGPDEAAFFRFEINSRSEAHLADLLAEFEHEHECLPKYNASHAAGKPA